MLKALYDYGLQNGLAIPPGFQSKAIRAYICLSGAGEYLGIEPCEEEKQVCPVSAPWPIARINAIHWQKRRESCCLRPA